MTYTEFLEWLEFLRWEEDRHTKSDYYMAQVAAEIRRSNVKNPRKVRVQDFLLKSDPVIAKKSADSKKVWAAALKINLN